MNTSGRVRTLARNMPASAMNIDDQPLKLPSRGRNAAEQRALSKLYGHTTSAAWLPAGLSPLLDELRDEQQRLLRQVAADVDALESLDTTFAREDTEHVEALRQAHRDGAPSAAEDGRTPPEERAAQRASLEERMWAGVHVLAEHADRVIEAVREHEDVWLADLKSQLVPTREKRRQAQQLLAEAQAEEFRLYKLGQWVQVTADDAGFGRQPAPQAEPVPDRMSVEALRGALERPWHRRRPWNRAQSGAAA